jgi:hypothetical protein
MYRSVLNNSSIFELINLKLSFTVDCCINSHAYLKHVGLHGYLLDEVDDTFMFSLI